MASADDWEASDEIRLEARELNHSGGQGIVRAREDQRPGLCDETAEMLDRGHVCVSIVGSKPARWPR